MERTRPASRVQQGLEAWRHASHCGSVFRRLRVSGRPASNFASITTPQGAYPPSLTRQGGSSGLTTRRRTAHEPAVVSLRLVARPPCIIPSNISKPIFEIIIIESSGSANPALTARWRRVCKPHSNTIDTLSQAAPVTHPVFAGRSLSGAWQKGQPKALSRPYTDRYRPCQARYVKKSQPVRLARHSAVEARN